MPIQLCGGRWPDAWTPINDGTFDQEPFAEWWPRVSRDLEHLDPRVAEQWVHRHWTRSAYFGFDLTHARSELVRMTTAALIDNVRSVDDRRPGDIADPDHVFTWLNQRDLAKYEPMRTMNATGTWDMPILVLRSEDGFAYDDDVYPDARLWLVEGHQRLRYLRALAHKKRSAVDHHVLLLVRE
jgi:hypothetical protein